MALSIAGFDPSGGAGILMDIKTFSALEVYGGCVITALTIQNTFTVSHVYPVSYKIVGRQIDILMNDIPFVWCKVGLLPTFKIVKILSQKSSEYNLKLIVDPIFLSSSGFQLVSKRAFKALKNLLLPKAYIVTPNINEAERLSGISISNLEDMQIAAEKISELGVENVLIKGGHLNTDKIWDILKYGKTIKVYSKKKIIGDLHGSGCVFSSALTAELAKGNELCTAFLNAEKFMDVALKNTAKPGKGREVLPYFPK